MPRRNRSEAGTFRFLYKKVPDDDFVVKKLMASGYTWVSLSKSGVIIARHRSEAQALAWAEHYGSTAKALKGGTECLKLKPQG